MFTLTAASTSLAMGVPAFRASRTRLVWSLAGEWMPCTAWISTGAEGGIQRHLYTNSASWDSSLSRGRGIRPSFRRLASARRFVSYCLPPAGLESIHDLNAALGSMTGDPLEQYGGQIVCHRGSLEAKIMVVGEAPGAEEDRLGKPFVGRSGELLDKILGSVNINSDTDVYITNLVKRRPPGNRDPAQEEIDFYLPWLEAEMRILRPHTVLLMGRIAMKAVLGEPRGITKVHGTWYTSSDGSTATMPLYHPSYLLRNPARTPGSPRYQTWQDVQEVRRRIDNLSAL